MTAFWSSALEALTIFLMHGIGTSVALSAPRRDPFRRDKGDFDDQSFVRYERKACPTVASQPVTFSKWQKRHVVC
jgi:hypothetical protein